MRRDGLWSEAYAEMMMSYDSEPKEYARLAGFGYRMLAEAIKADLQYRISCPALLICGEKDKAGSAKDIIGNGIREKVYRLSG